MEQRLAMDGGGWLEVRQDNGQVHFSVSRSLDGAGLYKAWVFGHQGEMLLGTLIPSGRFLQLERTISTDALSRSGCWPVSGGKTAMVYSFDQADQFDSPPAWRWEHRPGRLFQDDVLAESACAWGSMLYRKEQDGFSLAAPFDPHRPFPMSVLFCFCKILPIDGQPHAVFAFDQDGHPKEK